MKEIRFLHFSDMHLDMPFTSLGADSGKSEIRRQDLLKVFRRIIGTAQRENADLVLIGGDLYEHDYVRKSTISYINDCFKSIPDIKVVITPGNHDPYTSDSYYRLFNWSENVHILRPDKPLVELADLRLCVYGGDFRESIPSVKSSQINILLSHGTLDMNFGDRVHNPLDSSFLDSLNMDYIALGHIHKRHEALGGKGIIYNPGSPEPLGFDEPGEHGIFLGTIKKDDNGKSSVSATFLKVNEKDYQNIVVDISGSCSDEQTGNIILKSLGDKDLSRTLLKITLRGYVEPGYKADTGFLESRFSGKAFFIKINDETVPDYDFDSLSAEPGLKGLFVRKMMKLIAAAESPKKKEIYTRALYYGIEALEHGEIKV
jgi:exonuclease SbcD